VERTLQESITRARPKLDELRGVARGKKTLLAQTHDFPDPDTIASALGLTWMLEELEGLETQIGYGGIIGRAENKAMIKVLGIRMRRTVPKDFERYDLVALLDTQPEAGNHLLPPERPPDIVFDHHFKREVDGPSPVFSDVGGAYGSTSTKVVELVMASGLEPPINVATALFYGVKTDTQNLGREASPADLAAYLYLFPRADNKLLAEIEHPQVPIDYFRVFNKAITRGKIYGNMIVSDLGEVYTPDLCAEVADRLLQIEGVNHSLAVGWYEESLFLSLRTRSRQKNAGRILHGIVCGHELGTAGGHGPMAGARISVEGKSQRARADMRRKVVSEVVQAFGQDHRRFQRVVSVKDAASSSIDPPPPRNGFEPAK
jgi:nanoRNase/pAp phosphatase (c-di-AMP/oligoRNAs hydrolase)